LTPNSFNINTPNLNSFDTWGIKVIIYDVFSPNKRSRRKQIPFRHGSYDMGYEKYYDDRNLRIECHLTKKLSKADFREIIYVLSQKSSLYFWDEPDKFYRCELFDSVDINVFPQEIGRVFILPFVCEPFAYGRMETIKFNAGKNPIEYIGTVQTPTILIIKNNNDFPISNILITAIEQIRAIG